MIDIHSFMAVTGPKTDIWLVKTVSVLLLAISFSFFTSLFVNKNEWPVIVLAAGCCIALALIDFYYSANGTISAVYSLDGIAQLILLGGWVIVIFRKSKRSALHL
jgi:protein-S-isoprenylcysteine O-methyltransferase Ste14